MDLKNLINFKRGKTASSPFSRTQDTTCFIFINEAHEAVPEGFLSLTLDSHNEVAALPELRNQEDIKDLQTNAKTWLVLPAQRFSLHWLALPKLPEKKARLAIPFALEEKLADNVENLFFAFDTLYYHAGAYLVVVCEKEWLQKTLQAFSLPYEGVTLDWFALQNNEACLTNQALLIHDEPHFCGALTQDLLPQLAAQSFTPFCYTFTDSMVVPAFPATQLIDTASNIWIAKRLQKIKPFNLCQGPFSIPRDSEIKRWYWAAALMGLLWCLSLFLNYGITIHRLNQKITAVDEKIAVIYRQFFPNAAQIISPRFRINQLLKDPKNNNDQSFWILLHHLTQAAQAKGITVEQLQFQNQKMQVTVLTEDFKRLEALQTRLQKLGLHVKQTQASSQENNVIGVLELSI